MGLGFALLGVLLGCAEADDPIARAAGGGPSIVLVVMDTVRADRLPLYGYAGIETPAIDALAATGRSFERAYSTSSWTAPAHASLFTGLHPLAHQTDQRDWSLAPMLPTLAEGLAARGYETVAVVGNAMLARELGWSRGFERYIEPWRSADPRRVDTASAEAIEAWLEQRDASRPFFLFVNLIGPHSPYDSCGEFCPEADEIGGPADAGADLWRHYLGRPFSPDEIGALARRYDAELRQVDAILARIVSAIEGGVGAAWSELVFALTSDHGEHFGEHGHMGHVFSLYEALVRVPLVLRAPGRVTPGTRSRAPVQSSDLYATLLAAADALPADAQGVDLAGDALPERALLLSYARPLQAVTPVWKNADDAERRALAPHVRALEAIVSGRDKWIVASDERVEFYRLHDDADERRERSAELTEAERQRFEAERKALHAALATRPARDASGAASSALDLETRRALEAMGYLR